MCTVDVKILTRDLKKQKCLNRSYPTSYLLGSNNNTQAQGRGVELIMMFLKNIVVVKTNGIRENIKPHC